MAGAIAVGNRLGIGAFVIIAFVEPDREGADRGVLQARHQRDHGAGIHAARQQRAHFDIGNQPQLHRMAQGIDHLRIGPGGRDPRMQIVEQIPIAHQLERLAPAHDQGMRGRQFADGGIDGLGIGDIAIGEEIFHRDGDRGRGPDREP